MRAAVELVLPVMRLGEVRPGRGSAVSIDVIVPINGKDHVVTFHREVNGRKRGTWASDEPAQFAASGYYRMVAAVLDALGRAGGDYDLAFCRTVLQDLHGYVSAVADAALDEYDDRVAAA